MQIVALRALNIDSLFLRVWVVDGERGGMLSRVDAVGEMVELQGSRNYDMSSKIPELPRKHHSCSELVFPSR